MAASGSKEDFLSRARSLLASINSRKLKGNIFQNTEQAAETLCCAIHLLQNLQRCLVRETFPLDPSSSEWKTLKALLELLIRLGISPHLSPGVGILRDKHQDDCSNISFHLSGLSISTAWLQSSSAAPLSGMPLLFLCAEVLASFFWMSSTCATLIYTTHRKSAETLIRESDTFGSPIEQRLDGTKTSPLDITCPPMAGNLQDEIQFLQIPSTRQLAMKFFLWDLMSAYLQLGFGSCETDEDISHQARVRLKYMVEHAPVEQMVVASFVLLNRDSPTPPPWIRAELGKQLSNLVMRKEGLVTILQELVGRVPKGSVESYDKVAGHLAKVPKSVTTTDEYLKALCPQLLPLLLLRHKPRDSVLGEISLATLNNIFHTSVSLTCKIFALEPKLAAKYLIQSMMRPLLALNSLQKIMDMAGNLEPANGEHTDLLVSENEVVDSLVQLSVLLTAGSRQGSLAAREAILLEAKVFAPLLLKLHFQLASSSPIISPGSTKHASALEGKGVRKGFLNNGLGFSGPSEQAYEDQSNLSELISCLADVVMAEVHQPLESALPCVLPFLLDHTLDVVRWSQEWGEVWEVLQLKNFQSRSHVMYLSRLLIMAENWKLVVALMGKLLHMILNAPWSLLKSGCAEFPEGSKLLRYMQDFEELNSEAGIKALEHDIHGAACLVEALLEDELVLRNKDIMELVLHMVYSVLKGIRASRGNESLTSNVHGSVLIDLLSSLQRVYVNASVSEELRQMSFTLAEEVSALHRGS
ncbi:hypothetical protein GOP47_0000529 [Adiantum capillus-veneris]|uniref:TANGO6 HEAT repeat domain-containing protein n=1 Tax=Adiantum capillus-veneris TaxID=13818 RepID=A0A9D4VD65_ADICA|nr:hypothetical protein GOP47_0000529 [Adiantum capillus-veneris]